MTYREQCRNNVLVAIGLMLIFLTGYVAAYYLDKRVQEKRETVIKDLDLRVYKK